MRPRTSFLRNTDGTIAVLGGLLMTTIIIFGGLAVDYGRAFSDHTALRAAADGAVLAAARALQTNPSLDEGQLSNIADSYFAANAGSIKFEGASPLTATFQINGNVVQATVTSEVPTTLLRIAGLNSIPVGVLSAAQIGGFAGEIAFVLDNSSSMSGSEHLAMLDATRALIDKLTTNKTNTNVKIGLVPFSKYVRVAMPGQYVLGGTPNVTWSNCTGDRRYPYNLQSSTPTTAETGSLWGRTGSSNVIDVDEYDDCDVNTPPSLLLRPLSTDHTTTDSQVAAMVVGSGTNIFVGMQFGWHILTPKGIWNDAAPFGQTKKYVILLTDGRQNQRSSGADGSFTKENALANMQTLCTNMKNQGITVVGITYDIGDPEGKEDLKTCVTSGEYYTEATASNIDDVMQGVGTTLMSGRVRLVR